jgi:hypothetical protein
MPSWQFRRQKGFRRLRKIAYEFRYVCPRVRMEQLGSHWRDFHEIWYLSIIRKFVEKIQISLKSGKNNGYFTWRPMYVYDNISLSPSDIEKCFTQNL